VQSLFILISALLRSLHATRDTHTQPSPGQCVPMYIDLPLINDLLPRLQPAPQPTVTTNIVHRPRNWRPVYERVLTCLVCHSLPARGRPACIPLLTSNSIGDYRMPISCSVNFTTVVCLVTAPSMSLYDITVNSLL
jgi:hypothetical protein